MKIGTHLARLAWPLVAFGLVLAAAFPAVAQQKDVKGCNDHPLFTRMPDYWIQYCDEKQYDEHVFDLGAGKKETVGGRTWTLRYRLVSSATSKPSEVQIHRNFENAVKSLGGAVVASPTKSKTVLKVVKDGKEFWVEVTSDWTSMYSLFVLQKEGMAQTIEANAEVFANDLKNTGRTAIYGIYFDTGKADVKPESSAALEEIAKLLKAEPSLKVFIVGHTDNVGTLDANMKLSQARADAVVTTLEKTHGVAAARMKGYGCGPYAPVASNDAEEGRAKNRRVELVKQ